MRCVTHDMTARVHDERLRRQQRFDLLEQEESLLATRNQPRRGRVQHEGCAFDLRRQRRDTCVARGARGPSERSARRLRPQASHRDPRNDQLVGGPRRRREGRGVELGERALGLVEAADQEQAPDLEIPRMRGVHAVAVRFERRPRCVERLRRPAQVARDERDLGLGDDTPRAGHGLFRTEGARRTSQQSLRADEIAELRHRDAAKRERRRVVAQGDPVQGAEGITRRERTRRGRDQRVHPNPATLVTPTVRCPVLTYPTTTNQHVDFNVSVTEEQQRAGAVEYNYERSGHALDAKPEAAAEGPVAFAAMTGTDVAAYARERPGMSAFAREDGAVYHAYSTYARGLDGLWGMYQWLDRAPKGRNETGVWWRPHDEYDKR